MMNLIVLQIMIVIYKWKLQLKCHVSSCTKMIFRQSLKKDVVEEMSFLNKILRECRRYFQTHLSDLTGFIASKKARSDSFMYNWMERFNIEYLNNDGSFSKNFYLACLLYPQDLARNVDIFIEQNEIVTKESHNRYKEIVTKIHETLYKYSHEKLDYFVSIPEISDLFMHFYEHGAFENISNRENQIIVLATTKWNKATDVSADPNWLEVLEYIKSRCEDSQSAANPIPSLL